MLIYVLLVLEIFFLNFLYQRRQMSKRTFCKIVGLSFILITGLRSVNVGSDTAVYFYSFEAWENIPFSQIWEERDLGYYALMWSVQQFTGSFTVLTFITAVVFYYSISKLIYRWSYDCGLSYLVLMAFNFFQFSMTGMRQTLALGFAVLVLLEMLEKRPNYLKMIIYFIIGTTMHRSCILVLLYFVVRECAKYLNVYLSSILLIYGCYQFRSTITDILSRTFEEIGFDLNLYEGSGGGLTTYLVYLLLLLGGLFLTYRGYDERKMSNVDLWMMVLTVATQSFVMVNSIFFRVVWYFAIYFIIYIPKFLATSRFDERSEKIVRMAMYCGVLFMYFGITMASANVVPYQFFWQG